MRCPPEPVRFPISDAHEVAGVGVIAPNEAGKPVLHIHAALGREGRTHTGCLRPGVKIWLVGEAILTEILDTDAMRIKDPSGQPGRTNWNAVCFLQIAPHGGKEKYFFF